jgi:ribosomal protein L16 Arg81 hydroxylase
MPNNSIINSEPLSIDTELPEVWRQWVGENQALGIPSKTLIQTLVDHGIAPDLAIGSVRVRQELPVKIERAESESIATQKLAKLESTLEVYCQLAALASGGIERRSQLSRQEFLERYYATNTPVIITGMMQDWPAIEKWSPEFLKTHYGEAKVEIQTNRASDQHYEINANHHKRTVPLGEYVDMVLDGGESNDYYLVAGNQNLERDRLKGLLDDVRLPDFLDPTQIQQRVFFWFGPSGTVTPLHHDHMNVMMAQVVGRKRWRLISPNATPVVYNEIGVYSQVDLENIDYEKYPLFKQAQVLETIVEPGELIFVPVGWWHQVVGLDVSLSLSFINFDFPNQFSYKDPSFRSIASPASTQTSPKPPAIQTSKPRLSFAKLFRDRPLTYEAVQENVTDGYLVDRIVPNQPLMISFGFVSWDGPPVFDFFGRSQKVEVASGQHLNRILLRDFGNAWYQRGVHGLGDSVDEVVDHLQKIIHHIAPSRVITVGQSMGAYAAILFGHLLEVDQVLAFGSLSSMDSQQAESIGDRRWLSVMQDLEGDRPAASYLDLLKLPDRTNPPKIDLFYGKSPDPETPGPINLDHIHAGKIAQLPHCTLHSYEESGHAIVKYLIDRHLMDQVLMQYLLDK